MLVGYARVSTQDQHLALQIDALHKAGCERIFEDKISVSKTDRVGLANAISHLRKDDTLVVWKLDRLGRSVKDLVRLITQLEGQGVHFKSLTDVIDTSTPSGRFFFNVMASLSQMERELTIERGFVAQINFELGFSLTHYLSRNTLCRWRTQMSETV